ncbi:uncharacterized protein LOC128986412 [Macrosteles quadrilineatus]|uniref:uncharacterized protein LOC128986412 n=1 Tax=Macrosteles quadrilineatus TaxID=74068 RepID=UPI0023E179B2|nr:uncharacterized protein LOC128986412 [Macrosteles quadrilineatus]
MYLPLPAVLSLSLGLLSVAISAPSTSTTAGEKDKDSSEESYEVVYDQRQNGTDNLRVSVEDVMVVVAPSEGLMQAGGSALNSLALGVVGAAMLDRVKTPDCGAEGGRCKSAPGNSQRSRLRLSNLLQPLFNRVQHH